MQPSPNIIKCIIDLEGYGKIYKAELISMGISTEPIPGNEYQQRYVDYVYNESASQILQIMQPDPHLFVKALQTYPDLRYFSNISCINDPVSSQYFIDSYRRFALGLMMCIHKNFGTNINEDYLLESIGSDMIIICRIVKKDQHAFI